MDGPRLIMLVPEQAALQTERALSVRMSGRTLGRCEVLSFRRLAHRILNEAPGAAPAVLSATGRQMALRHLIGRHRQSLREFAKVADRPGLIAALSRTVTELLQEAVSAEQLEVAAQAAADEQHPAATRLRDVALLYRAYLEYLGSQRVDPEGVLDLARARLDRVPWINGAAIWIDGFAGLTQQQIRMISALALRAAHLDIALLLDPTRSRARDPDGPPDDLSLFARTERTWFALARVLHDAGVATEQPIVLGRAILPRLKDAALLAELERNLFSLPLRTVELKPSVDASAGTVRLVRAPHRRAEVAAAVRSITDLTQRPRSPLRYRDVSIIVRDLEPYHQLISAELRASGIPFFIDRRRPTHHHPLVQLLRAALAMLGSGPFDQAVAMLLKSGLSGLDDADADALENYLLAYGLRASECWDEPWLFAPIPKKGDRRTKATAVRQEPPQPYEPVDRLRRELRQRLGEWRPAGRTKPARSLCRTWVRKLYGLLQRLEAPQQLAAWCDEAVARGDLDEAAEHEQTWTDLVKLLDQLVDILGDEAMTGPQFRDVVESGLSEFTLGLVPATLDQVLVGSIERSRHPPVRAVFVLGFNDGLFPARRTDDGIIGDEERLRLERAGVELGRTQARQLLDERMLAYVAFTRPSELLWVSYSETDGNGKPLAPSPFWPHLQAALPGINVEAAEAEGPETIGTPTQLAAAITGHMRLQCEEEPRASAPAAPPSESDHSTGGRPRGLKPAALTVSHAAWLSLYEWARSARPVAGVVQAALKSLTPPEKTRLSPGAAAALWPPPYRTSVTRLESFSACPFQHFAGYGLRLEPRPIHEIAELDLGRLYHLILEQFVNELMETGTTLREMPAGRIAESLSRLCRSVVPQYAEAIRMEQREQQAAVRRGERELPHAVRGQQSRIGRTPLRPLATERTFGDEADDDLPALELRLADGRTVLVRGAIDRIDVVQTGEAALAVVFDYKRSIGRTLRLDQVFHGLALQLLAYLLVIREHGAQLSRTTLTPGGAFYLPLLAGIEKVDHPDDATEEDFDPYRPFGPRGIIDFDWIDALDPALGAGGSSAFAARRTKDGAISHIDSSDAVGDGKLPLLLDHVRRKMTELTEDWLSGNIAVAPYRLGKETPCPLCQYRTVCRIEYATREARSLARMKRSVVLEELARTDPSGPSRSGSGRSRKDDAHG
jgi:ATP-dependent helicase/nuclease subunit B